MHTVLPLPLLLLLLLLLLPAMALAGISPPSLAITVPQAAEATGTNNIVALQADILVAFFAISRPEIAISRLATTDFGSVVERRAVSMDNVDSVVAPGFVPVLFASGALLDAGRRGLFRDVRPLLEKHDVYNNIPLAMRRRLEMPGGGLMAVPSGGDVLGVFCPARFLDDGQPPRSFADMVRVMERAKTAGVDIPLLLFNNYDVTSALMLSTYGPVFMDKVVDGTISMTDERLRPWAEAVELMHREGYTRTFTENIEVLMTLQGNAGCVFVGSTIFTSASIVQPESMVGPFPFPGIEGHLMEKAGFKAALSSIALTFVPARSAQREIGMQIMEFGIEKRLELVKRGPPFTDDERLAIGAAMPFASLDDLNKFPDDFAVHIATQKRQLALDTIVAPLGVGSPAEMGFDYLDFMETVLYNASRPDLTADALMATLEAIRVEKFLSAALPPVGNVKPGRYMDDIDITLTSMTKDARIHVTLDGQVPTPASPRAPNGQVTISASGTTTLRAIAVTDDLNPSDDISLVYTIERASDYQTALIIGVVCGILVLVILVATAIIVRKRAHFPTVDVDQMTVDGVIGVGGRAVVFAGTYRGANVAVKEFVSQRRMRAIIKQQRADLNLVDSNDDRSMLSSNLTGAPNITTRNSKSKMTITRAFYLSGNTSLPSTTPSAAIRERRAQMQDFKREVRALSRVRHPNIVTFLGAFQAGKRRGIVLELMERGSLADILANPSQILGWRERVRLALDAARGLAYLHAQSPPILHHDIKSYNLLIGENNVCKVADFGASVDDGVHLDMGTIAWMAPEVIRKEQYTVAADVFSFGVVLWEIASRRDPGSGRTAIQMRRDTLAGARLPIDRGAWPADLCDMIEHCWAQDANMRPSMTGVTKRLAAMLADLPDDVRRADTSSVSTGAVIVGKTEMKQMQATLLGGSMPRAHVADDVSVVFADIVDFSLLTSSLDPADVADLLGRFFTMLDELAAEYGVLRFQTVGDAYIGIASPSTRPSEFVADEMWTPERAICEFAIAAVDFASRLPVLCDGTAPPSGFESLAVRAGIASGPVAFQLVTFDRMEILGDTVNLASKMEISGVRRRVMVTEAHYALVRDDFPDARKRKVKMKGKGRMHAYLLGDAISPDPSAMTIRASRLSPTPARAVLPPLPGQAQSIEFLTRPR